MRSFLTPWPWLVVGFAVVAMTVGTLAWAQGEDCSLIATHEAKVECYLAGIAADDGLAPAATVVADLAPVALVVMTVGAAVGLARVGGAAVR